MLPSVFKTAASPREGGWEGSIPLLSRHARVASRSYDGASVAWPVEDSRLTRGLHLPPIRNHLKI